jgi:hypothetical protein
MSKGIVGAPGAPHIGPLLARAHGAECTRICHVLKALECVQDAELRELWHKRLQLARSRADMLARMLAQCEQRPPAAPPAAGDCLLDAMELALRNGDLPAAEAVARECVALADIQCACAWRELDDALSQANAMSARVGPQTISAQIVSAPDTTAR